ncbi:J domain-containing protein [Novosphingobium sp. BL-8A]|uniref:J domain-containing protein n=1 Tax=Novosphingobium sp. BL-8A TaxID=3127639 RepID=UPI003756F4BD
MKLIWLIALGCIAWKLATGQWPWRNWRRYLAGSRESKAPSFAQIHAQTQARAVLGVPEGASREAILEAHRRRVIQVHPDRGGSSEKIHEANAARDLLLETLDGGTQA